MITINLGAGLLGVAYAFGGSLALCVALAPLFILFCKYKQKQVDQRRIDEDSCPNCHTRLIEYERPLRSRFIMSDGQPYCNAACYQACLDKE